jgi:hypothetical protein
MGWAGRPGPIGLGPIRPSWAPASSCLLLVSSRTFHFLHVGPCYEFLRGLNRAPCRTSFSIFCLGPWSFTALCFGPFVTWSHVHFVFWFVPGFMIFSQSVWWTFAGSVPFSVKSLHKQSTPNTTCECEHDIWWGLGSLVWILINTNTEGKLMARLTKIHLHHLPMLKPCSSSSKPSIDIRVAFHYLNPVLDHTRENIILSKF